jgi:hypothetical protein
MPLCGSIRRDLQDLHKRGRDLCELDVKTAAAAVGD